MTKHHRQSLCWVLSVIQADVNVGFRFVTHLGITQPAHSLLSDLVHILRYLIDILKFVPEPL
jgi:hypothetical protein